MARGASILIDGSPLLISTKSAWPIPHFLGHFELVLSPCEILQALAHEDALERVYATAQLVCHCLMVEVSVALMQPVALPLRKLSLLCHVAPVPHGNLLHN